MTPLLAFIALGCVVVVPVFIVELSIGPVSRISPMIKVPERE